VALQIKYPTSPWGILFGGAPGTGFRDSEFAQQRRVVLGSAQRGRAQGSHSEHSAAKERNAVERSQVALYDQPQITFFFSVLGLASRPLAKRIWLMTHAENVWVKWLLLIPFALTFICLVWGFILIWYCLFGILLIPWRLLRRSDRKKKKRQLQHRELLEQLQKSHQ
jgi:hypothetical protein